MEATWAVHPRERLSSAAAPGAHVQRKEAVAEHRHALEEDDTPTLSEEG